MVLCVNLKLTDYNAWRVGGSFLEFSLCLSRACLGKIIIFIYKWVTDRIGAGYTVGNRAAIGGDTTAVLALIELLREGHDNARRAAMYGLAAAGDLAVPVCHMHQQQQNTC